MQQRLMEHVPKYIPVLALTLFLAFLSAYSHSALLISVGILLYILLVFLALNEQVIKAVLPIFLLVILFQDTLAINLELVSPSLGSFANYLDEVFLIIVLSALAINFLSGKIIQGGTTFICLAALTGLGFISGLINEVPVSIALQGAFLVMKGLLYLFFFMNLTYTEYDLKRYVRWGKSLVGIVVVFAVVDLILGDSYRQVLGITYMDNVQRGAIHSLSSLFMHPGIYGWFMVFAGMYALSVFVIKKDKRILLFASFLFFFAMLSFRFKVMMAILIILAVVYLLSGLKKSLTYLLPVAVVFFFVFLLTGEYIGDLTASTIDSYVTADIEDSARKALYLTAYEIGLTNFPFGEGFGRFGGFVSKENYSPVYYEYGINDTYGLSPDYPAFMTDTYWPNIAGELGFIGVGIVIVLYIYLAAKLLLNYAILPSDNLKIFVLFSGLVMVQALVESIGEPIFNGAPQNVFIFITVGIAFSILNSTRNRHSKNSGGEI